MHALEPQQFLIMDKNCKRWKDFFKQMIFRKGIENNNDAKFVKKMNKFQKKKKKKKNWFLAQILSILMFEEMYLAFLSHCWVMRNSVIIAAEKCLVLL